MAPGALSNSSKWDAQEWLSSTYGEIVQAWEDGSMNYATLLGDENHENTLQLIKAYAAKFHEKKPPNVNLVESVVLDLLDKKKNCLVPKDVYTWWWGMGLPNPAEDIVMESSKEMHIAHATHKHSALSEVVREDYVAAELTSQDDEYEIIHDASTVHGKGEALMVGNTQSSDLNSIAEDKGDTSVLCKNSGELNTARHVLDVMSGKFRKTVDPVSALFNVRGTTEQRRKRIQALAAPQIPALSELERESVSSIVQKTGLPPSPVSMPKTIPPSADNTDLLIAPPKPSQPSKPTALQRLPAPLAESKPAAKRNVSSTKRNKKRDRTSPNSTPPKPKARKIEVTTGYKGNMRLEPPRQQVRSSGIAAATGKPMYESLEKPAVVAKTGTVASTPESSKNTDQKRQKGKEQSTRGAAADGKSMCEAREKPTLVAKTGTLASALDPGESSKEKGQKSKREPSGIAPAAQATNQGASSRPLAPTQKPSIQNIVPHNTTIQKDPTRKTSTEKAPIQKVTTQKAPVEKARSQKTPSPVRTSPNNRGVSARGPVGRHSVSPKTSSIPVSKKENIPSNPRLREAAAAKSISASAAIKSGTMCEIRPETLGAPVPAKKSLPKFRNPFLNTDSPSPKSLPRKSLQRSPPSTIKSSMRTSSSTFPPNPSVTGYKHSMQHPLPPRSQGTRNDGTNTDAQEKHVRFELVQNVPTGPRRVEERTPLPEHLLDSYRPSYDNRGVNGSRRSSEITSNGCSSQTRMVSEEAFPNHDSSSRSRSRGGKGRRERGSRDRDEYDQMAQGANRERDYRGRNLYDGRGCDEYDRRGEAEDRERDTSRRW